MSPAERKSYIRLIYSRALRCLGIGLALSAIVGGLYQNMLFTVYALCAAGMCFICWGWFIYLKSTGVRLLAGQDAKKKRKTPYLLRRFKEKKPARPSFRMTSEDFDDDLTAATAVNEGAFTKKQVTKARMAAFIAAGVLLIIISFFIKV